MRSRLSHSAKGNQKLKASHPSSLEAKAQIRRNVLELIQPAHVFDAFAGNGTMHDMVWCEAASYVGCDLEWHRDGRLVYVADNRRIMRAIDLQTFNIFDLDAHGAPWEQLWILAHRRIVDPGERIGIVMTEGTGLKLKMGGMPIGLCHMARVSPGLAGVVRAQSELQDRAILNLCRIMECKLVKRWQAASRSATKVYYDGLVLEGIDPAAEQVVKRRPRKSTPRPPGRARTRKKAPVVGDGAAQAEIARPGGPQEG